MLTFTDRQIAKFSNKEIIETNLTQNQNKKNKCLDIDKQSKSLSHIIQYFNHPNFCLNCKKIVPPGDSITYLEAKSNLFCSKICEAAYHSVNGEWFLENMIRETIEEILICLINCDSTKIDYYEKILHTRIMALLTLRKLREKH